MIDKNKMKNYKGEKYIYLLMGYKLALLNGGSVTIGRDSGFTGGQNKTRDFSISVYNGKTLLTETKSSSGFADFSRTFEVSCPSAINPSIWDYMNDDFENCGRSWTH